MTRFALTGWPFLLLLLLIPAGWLLMRSNRVRLPYPDVKRLIGERRRPRFWWLAPSALRSGSLALVAIALVHPVRVWEKVESEREGVAIVLAVDISSSMLAEDFRPDNRIEVAKREVVRFVEGRESDWIGLVAFAGEALTMVPGTLDHAVVEAAVERLEAGQLRDGTAIGVALATAANRLRDLEPESRIVVLLTDGDNNSGGISPEEATAAAASLGIRVYTIGVGRDGVAPVPVAKTAFGYQYANIRVHVNDELLDQMATQTGGLYFRATDPEGLTRIYERINELETTPLKEVRTEERVGLRRELLLAALGLLLLELLAGATRARRVWA
ncbi:MAG: VWA domain-containing protein [Gemmatimonadetes bacterium]|nr:VWA domain-containing protein [Gemmatimonadota bacterium]